jgi:hypothetical protein
MPRGSGVVDPVAGAAGFCQCGYDLPPAAVKPTDLWVACHRAHHLAWLGPRGLKEWRDLAHAQTIAIDELDAYGRHLREQINTRDDVIASLEADLDWERRQAAMKGHQ